MNKPIDQSQFHMCDLGELEDAMYQVQLDSFQKIKKPKAVEALIHEQFLSGAAR